VRDSFSKSKTRNDELRELALTLWSTGRFESRAEAERAARVKIEAERVKRQAHLALPVE
jgi:Arc/MetJ-type ribon-helix-helix transcriptional regulator